MAAFIVICASVVRDAAWVDSFDAAVRGWFSSVYSARWNTLVYCFTELGDVVATIVIALIFLTVLVLRRQSQTLRTYMIAFLSGEAVMYAFKFAVNRARPTMAYITVPSDPSFPSGHAFTVVLLIGLIAIYACAYLRTTRGKAVLWVLVIIYMLLMGMSRLYLGVHWPTDVLGGYLFGISWLTGSMALVSAFPSLPLWADSGADVRAAEEMGEEDESAKEVL